MNNAVRLRRLNLLLDTLKSVPQKRFDMETWASKGDGGTPKENLSCGSAACALGWLASTKQARKAGLKLILDKSMFFGNYVYPSYKGHEDYSAGAEYLGITNDEAKYLFHPEHYITEYDSAKDEYKPVLKGQVIKRVKELIKRYEKV